MQSQTPSVCDTDKYMRFKMFLLAVRQHGQGDLRVCQAQPACGEQAPG